MSLLAFNSTTTHSQEMNNQIPMLKILNPITPIGKIQSKKLYTQRENSQ